MKSKFLHLLNDKLVKLVNLVMQSLKATKRQSDTTIFAESVKVSKFHETFAKSLKSLMSIFANRGVKDVRVSLGQYPTNIQRISNLYLTPNRFFTRFAAVFALVFVMGVGNVWGVEGTEHDFTDGAFSQLLNNNASLSGKTINIAAQSYPIKEVKLVGSYNKSITHAVTISVSVGGNSWGSQYVESNSSYSKIFATNPVSSVIGAVSVSFVNNTGDGTGHGTFNVTKVVLVEGGAATPATIALNNYSGNTSTSGYNVGQNFTLPSTNDYICGTKTFVGWSTVEIATTNTKPTNNFHEPGASVTLAGSNTFYAVFADEEEGDPEWSTTTLASLTNSDVFVFAVNVSGTYYAMPNNGGTSSAPSLASITVSNNKITSTVANNLKWNISGNATNGYVFYPNGSSTTWMYCNTTATSKQNDNIRVGTGSRKAWKVNNDGYLYNDDVTGGTRYFSRNGTSDFRSYLNTGTNPVIPVIFKYGSGTTYSNYATSCCTELAQINGSVSVTNQRSLTLQWEKLSGVDGTTPYTITCKQGTEDAGTIGDIDLSGAKATCTVTGLACGTTYTFTITAHGDATHCDKTQENIQGTTSAAMTLPTLTYATGLTAGGANITPSWASAVSHDGSVTYVSSDPSVVQIVNASTGEAKPVGAGTATITATYAQSTNNCEASKTSNTITVTGNVSVSFNANGGGGTMTNQSIQVNTQTELKENEFTAPSSCQYFYGWATSKENADAGTRAYENGQSVTINAGMELFAIWKTYNYTVTDGTNEGAATFTLPSNVDCGGTISITCAADGTHKGNPTITATEGKYSAINVLSTTSAEITGVSGNITVNISYAAKENYSITWKVNGEALTGSALDGVTTNVLEGGSITNLPASPTGLDCAATFMGWSADEIGMTPLNNEDDAARIAALALFKNAANAPAIAANTTFHAVFATETGGGGTIYNLVSSAANFTDGTYVVAALDGETYYFMDGTSAAKGLGVETTGLAASSVSEGSFAVSSLPSGAIEIEVEDDGEPQEDNHYYYIYYISGDDTYFLNDEGTKQSITWTTNTEVYTYHPNFDHNNTTDGCVLLSGSRAKVSQNGSDKTTFVRNYASDGSYYNDLYFFKKTSLVAYDNYVTKCCKPWDNPTVAYGSYNLVAGGEHASVTITGTQHGTPEFSSSNTSVIEVNASTGEVTPVGAGTAHVIVTWPSANDYCEKTLNSSDFTVTGIAVITFKLNGGSVAGDVEKTQEVTTGEDVALTSLATLGYVAPACKDFGGWAASEEDANAATPVVFKADGATINVSEATNLWAIWNTIQYDVTKGSNSGAATFTLPAKVDCGGTISITCEADGTHKGDPTISATEGKYTNINVLSATSAEITGVSGDIEVSISYTPKASYAITWNVNGVALEGAALGSAPTLIYEDDEIEALPSNPSGLTCKNTFKGWSTKSAGTVAKTTAYYDDLFTDAADAPAISGATDFYAVFGSASAPSTNLFSWDGGAKAGLEALDEVEANSLGSDYAESHAPYRVKFDGTGDYIDITTEGAIASVSVGIKLASGAPTSTSSITVKESTNGTTFTDVETLDISGTQNAILNLSTTQSFASTSRRVRLYFTKGGVNVGVGPISITGVPTPDLLTECAAVEAPTFDVEEGTYNAAQTVKISNHDNDYMYFYTTDGTDPAADANLDPTGTSAEYDDNDGITIDKSCTLKVIAYNDEVVASAITSAAYVLQVATPTISGTTAFLENAEVTIEATGADAIYYTDDNSDPASSDTKKTYSGSFPVESTKTIKAIAVKANWTSSEVAEQVFTKVTPMTVAAALTNIDALANNGTIEDQYVKGLISEINSYSNGTITYYISDDGTTSSQLQVYRGSAGVANGGNAFTSASDLKVGEEVVVFGTLKKYKSGSNPVIPEFVNPNEIVAYRPFSPIAWSANAYTAEIGGSNSFPTLNGTDGLTISYSSSDETVATISADGTTYDLKKVGSTTITATSEANASYVATTKSYTLTVAPTVIRVDLDIECNGATSGCPATTHMTKQTNLPDPLPAVAKAGKNFGGWYTDNTFETPAVAGAALTENTTMYAQWLEPYTVAEALTIIDALGNDEKTAENVYVAGVVTDDAVEISSSSATYYIKDVSVDNRLEVYKGKGLNNADVAAGDLQEGDQVVVYGQLMKYKGYSSTTKPEIVNPNHLYSKVRPTFDVTSVSVASTANVRAGKTITLTATIEPANATDKAVTWSSDAEGVATVDENGVVTGVAEGTAHITVTTHDGGFQATCTVTVAGALPTFTEDDHEWIKITNASKLVAGRFYVIASETKGKTATVNISNSRLAEVATTFADGIIASDNLGTNTAIFELGGTEDNWTLYEVNTEKYLSGTTASLSWSDDVTTTAIAIVEGDATIGSSTRILHNVNSKWFATYSSNTSTSMLLPQLYMWAELSHSVTFDANGGVAESVPGVERTDEGKIIIPATTPTHSDKSKAFGGWYKSDAPAALYNAGDEFETNVDVTLYAKWNTVPTYTVTYVPGGAGTVPAVASYREGQKVQVEEASLSNPGYSFAGWTVKDAEQNVLPLDEENKFEMPASNVTITAVWSRISNQKWTLVKQGETLEIDAEYVIAYNSTNTKKALSSINTSGSTHYGNSVEVTIDGEVLKGSELMKTLTLKAGNGGSNYAFKNGDNYLTWSSGNSLDESETLENASSWTIEIDENNVATISNVGTEARKLQYNTGSPRFACYTGSQKDVQLYKKAASVVINNGETVEAAGITANADVTIKNGGTLNVDADKQIGDLTVEAGGEVTLSSNKLTVVGTFTIETTMASGASGQLNGATESNFEAQEDAYIDITLGDNGNPEKWHAFTVPFPVDAINGIYDLDGKKLVNEVNYAIMDYHGDIRATGKYGWKKFRGIMTPGTFYLMTVDGERTTYRFKKKAGEALVAGNSKTVYEYAASGEGESTDAGWNGIGNPTLMYGKVNAEVQVLDPVNYVYVKKDANTTNFVVGTPFFYQASGDGSIAMLDADAGANYAPARTPAKSIENIKVAFGNEEFTDYLDISASEEALNEYQIGKDLVKMTMTSTPKVAQIFGKAYNAKLCMVYAPMANDQAVYDLTLYAPKAGEYTIAAPNVENTDLYLTYEGSIIWDLSMSAYPMELKKGNNEGYGLLLQAKMPMTPTGIVDVQGDNVQCTKVVIDEHVYILRGGEMYDVTGKAVK